MCRVLRLSCYTIPRFDGSYVDRFGNALIKSVLLRPCCIRRMRHAGEVDLLEPYFDLLNSRIATHLLSFGLDPGKGCQSSQRLGLA